MQPRYSRRILEEKNGIVGHIFYGGFFILTCGLVLMSLDGFGGKGYKSGYIRMIGPALVILGFMLVSIKVFYLAALSYKKVRKKKTCGKTQNLQESDFANNII